MAPRKAASPAKPRRVTRARAADPEPTIQTDEPPKRKSTKQPAVPTTSRAKEIEAKSKVTKKADTTASRATKSGRPAARVTKSAAVEASGNNEEGPASLVQEPSGRSRASTRNAVVKPPVPTVASGLAAAPRRRVRVVPLDTASHEPAPVAKKQAKAEKEAPIDAKTQKKVATKPSSSRGKKDAGVGEENGYLVNATMKETESKKRGRGRATKAEPEPEIEATQKVSSTTTKARGRTKKDTIPPVQETRAEPVTTRQTRSRAGSAASSVAMEPHASLAKPPKKKVTFEALPDDEEEDDDEKENKRPRTMSKSKGTKPPSATTKKNETTAKGMRAKPIRRPTASRASKSTQETSAKTRLRPVPEVEVEDSGKSLPRVLTPKKITQVAKATSPESEDEEDELAGPNTPIRDLSLSPKRNATAPRSLSPVKMLDFAPALDPMSPEKSAPLGISSPPRRLPASPPKESLKDSPRRAPEGTSIFRAHIHDTNNTTSLGLSPSHKQPQLLQSPKRGLIDNAMFPPSAMKAQMSPAKISLLSSPARRLFSPSKQKTPGRISPSPKKKSVQDSTFSSKGSVTSPDVVEVSVSSHFRSSVSPQRSARVYRMNDDELAREVSADVDFDESILNIRSPLKMAKAQPVVHEVAESVEMEDHRVSSDVEEGNDEEHVEIELNTPAANGDSTTTPNHDTDETINDSDVEMEDIADVEANIELDDGAAQGVADGHPTLEKPVTKPRKSDTLFRRIRNIAYDSDDDLSGEQTPNNRILKPTFRPSLSAANSRSRLSTGIAPASASRNLGFTPLVAQVQGWHAASPEKRAAVKQANSHGVFSPAAQDHIAGAVEVNRQDTPVREAKKRKSIANRLSFAPSMTGSPAVPNFFADGMAAHDFEDQNQSVLDVTQLDEEDLHNLVQHGISDPIAPAEEREIADSEDEESEEEPTSPGELTTDLIKFTNASDTAMVDFNALAVEAANMAVEDELPTEDDEEVESATQAPALEPVTEEQSVLSTSSGSYGDENEAPVEDKASISDIVRDFGTAPLEASLDDGAFEAEQEAVSYAESISLDRTPGSSGLHKSIEEMDFNVTPIRPDPSLPRIVHTVVSKVPLRPEGEIPLASSPIKVDRKRPRSLSWSNAASVKRRTLGLFSGAPANLVDPLATPKANVEKGLSPQRRIRSAAPSPAGSLATNLSTPGQMSFAIDDFGDSTLDGIEIPDEELFSDEMEDTRQATVDDSVLTIGSALFKTPAPVARTISQPESDVKSTPHYAMSTKSSRRRSYTTSALTPSRRPVSAAGTPAAARTPGTVSKTKTPQLSLKSKTPAKTPQTGRTPLKSVGGGALNGAIVHTDIHTSEGVDASAFYIDMLTSMGARVVKEWRWNPRASLTVGSEQDQPAETPGAGVGITHVIYKDGGKRTLEKVRSAKGQVLCVGVGWVLDCMREGKWLEESAYAVDASIVPRGGSRRRKSMEPRMLINENGSLSASRENRRSSGEYFGVTEEMKAELINTPVRGNERLETVENGVGDETEISSTYNSPTAATVGGDTADLRQLMALHSAGEPSGANNASPALPKKRSSLSATPQSTSLDVDYDPRTAATPMTPYLVAKGRGLVQMSAPPKQINKGIFDDEEGDDTDKGVKENGRKFQVKMTGKAKGNGKGKAGGGGGFLDARRKTLAGVGMAFKPVVGSPLRKA